MPRNGSRFAVAAGRKRALGTRAPLALPQGPNQRWSLDFLHDQLGDGRRFRILAIVDDFTRECLALVADTSLSGGRKVSLDNDSLEVLPRVRLGRQPCTTGRCLPPSR